METNAEIARLEKTDFLKGDSFFTAQLTLFLKPNVTFVCFVKCIFHENCFKQNIAKIKKCPFNHLSTLLNVIKLIRFLTHTLCEITKKLHLSDIAL